MEKKVSIGDIAKRLNISITTVSFILNGKAEEKRISSELAKKVSKLAKELGYVPNHLANSLRSGKTSVRLLRSKFLFPIKQQCILILKQKVFHPTIVTANNIVVKRSSPQHSTNNQEL